MKVGLIGLGAVGRVHFDCWRKSPSARLVAVADRDARKLAGDFSASKLNIGAQADTPADMGGTATYGRAEDLIADPDVEIVDICMPTPWHAPLTLAALRAGKHVFCEKPMSLDAAACAEMERVARETGRQLAIGHCLRYWPQYVRAHGLLASGRYGRALYARFHRSCAMPRGSSGGWLARAEESGGVLDMHIHDIDVALWWFGRPASVAATGIVREGLPLVMDAVWRWPGGLVAQLHGAWDLNGGAFRHAFTLVMEKATLAYDIALDPAALQLHEGGKTTSLPCADTSAYQAELDDFAACCAAGRPTARITPADGRLAVEIGLEELRQVAR